MAEYTDISELLEKRDNAEQKQYVQDNGIPKDQTLEASEFINKMVRPIIELQNDLKSNVVRVVKFNGQTIPLKEGGVVEFAQSGSVDTYGVSVMSDVDSTSERVIRKGDIMPVRLRYSAIKVSTIGETSVYRDVPGTMTITRQMRGSALVETLYTERGFVAVDRESTEWNVTIADLAEYCRTGQQSIRIQFSTTYEQNGSTFTIQNSVVFSVNMIDLSVRCTQDYMQPLDGSSGILPVIKFNVSGSVAIKYLHVEISGASQASTYKHVYQISDSLEGQYNMAAITDTALIGITNHGVHTIKAWLTCDDGSGSLDDEMTPNGLVSDTALTRLMVVNSKATDAERSRVYLLMQETLASADNYTQAHLTDFAIWKSSADVLTDRDRDFSCNIRLLVTNYSQTDFGFTDTYGEINYIGVTVGNSYAADCMIEIDSDDDTVDHFSAYMRIFRELADGQYENMLTVSQLLNTSFVGIEVRNSGKYAPTAGAVFYLNPKSRSNNEDDWNVIKNARQNNRPCTTVTTCGRSHSMWQKDQDGVAVLRVLAGETLVVSGEDIDAFGPLATNGKADVTIEIDYAARNITIPEQPIITLSEDFNGAPIGMTLMPQETRIACKGAQVVRDQSVGLCENKRTNVIFTINHDVDPSDADIAQYRFSEIDPRFQFKHISICRTYINGKCNNAFLYSTDDGTWQTERLAKQLVIGQMGADIDIYGMRIYDFALTSEQIKQNQVGAKVTTVEKDKMVHENAITDARGMVKKSLVENHLHRNTFTLHSDREQWKGLETSKQECYIELHIYDPKTGEELLDRGGRLGYYAYMAFKNGMLGDAKCLKWGSQGSTANTYGWHNGQGKMGDITYVVTISVTLLHADFGWKTSDSDPDKDGKVKYPLAFHGQAITGTEYKALPAEQQVECEIAVPDGWFDWNGMYHGQCWVPSPNGAKAAKLCDKINYASSMVSHKMGMTALLNDVMYSVLGSALVLPESHKSGSARFAVDEQPFFHFHQCDENGEAYFHGPSTFGSAKGDKPTWGYDKKKYPLMCMFEGSDNNVPLADFRIPFDEDVKPYFEPSKGDWAWAIDNKVTGFVNEMQFDFDLGLTRGDKDASLTNDVDKEAPTEEITAEFRKFCNLFYTHNTRFRFFNGSLSDLKQYYSSLADIEKRNMERTSYWCTSNYCLYRFNFTTLDWVDAGTWSDAQSDGGKADGYVAGVRNLSNDPITAAAFQAWQRDGTQDPEQLNTLFRQAIAQHFRDVASHYVCVESMLTSYNLINSFGCGTDNCSKNTYFVLCPIMINGTLEYRWYWFADDVDTIFKTDNNGSQTKPWWIFRFTDIEDYEHGYKPSTNYEGNGSVMFNLIEDAYDDNIVRSDNARGEADTPLQQNMAQVLSAMQSLVSEDDAILGIDNPGKNIMSCWHKYFLQYGVYFPIVAFNETGRIRYEYPAAWGYRSMGKGERNVDPITQHTGDQREAEIDFLEKRSVLFAQYACWGDASGATGALGVNDASGSISAKGNSSLGNLTFDFELVSDRPFYATAASGNSVKNPHIRVMPGQRHRFSLSTSGDQGAGLRCANYYTEVGNFGNARISTDQIAIAGARLRKLELTTTDPQAFCSDGLRIECTNIESIRFGIPGYKAGLDLSQCLRLREVDLSGSGVTLTSFPSDSKIHTIRLGNSVTDVTLNGMHTLETLTVGDYSNLTVVSFVDCPLINSRDIVYGCFEQGATLRKLHLSDVSWQSVPIQMLMWMRSIPSMEVSGHLWINEADLYVPAVSFDVKYSLIKDWGVPKEQVGTKDGVSYLTSTFALPAGNLSVTYIMRTLAGSISSSFIQGEVYTHNEGEYQYSIAGINTYCNAFSDIRWELSLTATTVQASIDPITGVLTVSKLSAFDTPTATVSATIVPSDGISLLPLTKQIGLYDRQARLGDLVYADGSYTEPAADDGTKTVVGVCFYVAPRDADGLIIPSLNKAEDKQQRLMVQTGHMPSVVSSATIDGVSLTMGGATGMAWGCYQAASGDGFYYTYIDPDRGLMTNKTISGIYDVINLKNIDTRGSASGATTVTDATVRDSTDAENAGFKRFGYNTSWGDGFASQEPDVTAPSGNEVSGDLVRYLDADLARLAGSTYKQGDMVNQGYINTLKIIKHRNSLLTRDWSQDMKFPASLLNIPSANGNTSEMQDLVNGIARVREYARQNIDSQNHARFAQVYYPAASFCYAYEPAVKSGEVLSERFRAHNWFLPTCGQLVRLYWYDKLATGQNAIFQAAYKKGKFTNFNASGYWSSTETSAYGAWTVNFSSGTTNTGGKYSTYVVRAVAAF